MKKAKKLESLALYSLEKKTSEFYGGCTCGTEGGTRSLFGRDMCYKSDTDAYDDETGDWLSRTYHDSDCCQGTNYDLKNDAQEFFGFGRVDSGVFRPLNGDLVFGDSSAALAL
jgi:hypothetical protein